MRCVYICSPVRGDIPYNISRLNKYAEYVAKNGKTPILPFVRGISCNSLIFASDELWVFGSYKTKEMLREINLAKSINLEVKYIKDSEVFEDEQEKDY
jgi:hypothetical protein